MTVAAIALSCYQHCSTLSPELSGAACKPHSNWNHLLVLALKTKLTIVVFNKNNYFVSIDFDKKIMFAANPFVICHNLGFVGGQKAREEPRQGRASDVTA